MENLTKMDDLGVTLFSEPPHMGTNQNMMERTPSAAPDQSLE